MRLKELLDYDPETDIFIWKIISTNSVKFGCKDNSGYIRML